MEQLDKRVKRILGQLRGIQNMIDEKRDHVEILQQVAAVKKAIDSLTREVIEMYFRGIVPQEKREEVNKMIERVINL